MSPGDDASAQYVAELRRKLETAERQADANKRQADANERRAEAAEAQLARLNGDTSQAPVTHSFSLPVTNLITKGPLHLQYRALLQERQYQIKKYGRYKNLCVFGIVDRNPCLELGFETPYYMLPLKRPAIAELQAWIPERPVCKEPEVNALHRSMVKYFEGLASPGARQSVKSHSPSSKPPFEPLIIERLCLQILSFVPAKTSLPEDQHHIFWYNILNACVIAHSPILRITSEFKMSSLSAYDRNANADISILLNESHEKLAPNLTSTIPILIGEVARPNPSFSAHKDYQKLATEMMAALMTLMGLLRRASKEDRQKLRVYGMLIDGLKMQLCIMFPVYETDDDPSSATIVFQVTEEWQFDLIAPKFAGTGDYVHDSDEILCGLRNIGQRDNPTSPMTPEEAVVIEESDQKQDWDRKDPPLILQQLNFTQGHHAVLYQLTVLGKLISDYGVFLNNLLRKVGADTDQPFVIPENLRDKLPRSRRTHESSTPGSKNLDKTPAPTTSAAEVEAPKPKSRPSNQRSRGNSSKGGDSKRRKTKSGHSAIDLLKQFASKYSLTIADHSQINGAIVGRCHQGASSEEDTVALAVVMKPVVQREVEITTALNQNRHANMISVFEYNIYDGYWFTVQPYLLTYDQVCSNEDPEWFLYTAFQYALDGCAGLIHLQENGIVHRDLSPGNVMYSPSDNTWKFVDFGLAALVEPGTSSIPHTGIYGTDGYIAPEILASTNPAPYSALTDIYSFGKCLNDCFAEPVVFAFPWEEHEYSDLTASLSSVADAMWIPDIPEKRQTPLAAREDIFHILGNSVKRLPRFSGGLRENTMACVFDGWWERRARAAASEN